MMKCSGIVDQKPNNVNGFCLLSRDMVIDSGIPEKNTEWYVKPGGEVKVPKLTGFLSRGQDVYFSSFFMIHH